MVMIDGVVLYTINHHGVQGDRGFCLTLRVRIVDFGLVCSGLPNSACAGENWAETAWKMGKRANRRNSRIEFNEI